jgi:peptide/nickel transport system substrate-binding protein
MLSRRTTGRNASAPHARRIAMGAGRWKVPSSVLAVVLVLAACASDEPDGGPENSITSGDEAGEDADEALTDDPDAESGPQELRIAVDSTVANAVDPLTAATSQDDMAAVAVLEGLVSYVPGGTGEVVNVLADELVLSDDGLRLDFRLKEGVQFHGGYGELTAEDVKFSFERTAGLIEAHAEPTYAADWGSLQEVEVTDRYEGTLLFREPFAPLLSNTLPGIAGLVISKDAAEDLGADFGTNPIGTGPYELASMTSDTVVLERFGDYGGAAYDELMDPVQWERISFQLFGDPGASEIALEAGEMDLIQPSATGFDRFAADDAFGTEEVTSFGYAWIGMNVEDEVLSDINVRRAIRLALDVESFIEVEYEGRATRAHALVAPDMPLGYWDEAPTYERDLDAAREYLEAAGIEEGEVTLNWVNYAEWQSIAEIAQANLAEIGIGLEIDILEYSAYRERVEPGNHQLFGGRYTNQADPSWATVWFTCEQVGQWNDMRWCNDEFDELHAAALIETDPEERHAMYVRMQELMDEDAVATWINYTTDIYAFTSDIELAPLPERPAKILVSDIRHRS